MVTAVRSKGDEAGAAAMEYGVMITLILVAIISTVVAIGLALQTTYDDTCGDIDTAGVVCATP